MKVYESNLRDAVIEYLESIDRCQNCHVHLRLADNGELYVSTDAGYTISEAEFNRAPGHTITIRHQQAHGQCLLEDDWTDMDEHIDGLADVQDAILADLVASGVNFELVE